MRMARVNSLCRSASRIRPGVTLVSSSNGSKSIWASREKMRSPSVLVAAQQRPMEQAAWELPQNLKAHVCPTSEQLSTDRRLRCPLPRGGPGLSRLPKQGRPAALKAIEFVLQLLKLLTLRVCPYTGHNQRWPILENQSYTLV